MNRRVFLGTAAAAVGGAAVGVGGTLGVTAATASPLEISPAGPPSSTAWLKVEPSDITSAVGALDGIVTDLMRRTGMPGVAFAVVHKDRVVASRGFGIRKVGAPGKVGTDSVFQLASISKSISATVVAAAVAQGVVAWDDTVVSHLPTFALKDADATRMVTLADMFSHRSGLPDHAGDILEDIGYGRDAVLDRLRFYPLTPIRTQYAYTNFGLTAAAEAVARAAGMPWDRLADELLFRPAGMSSTSMRFDAYAGSSRRAWGHVQQGASWVPAVRDPDPQAPAGGVSTTVEDMARWMRMLLADGQLGGTRILPAPQIQPIRTPHAVASPPRTAADRTGLYGLGMNVGVDSSGRATLSHSGAFATSVGTAYTLLPAEDLGIITLGNGMAIGLVEAVNFSFMDIVETGKVRRDWYALMHEKAFAPLYVNHSVLAGKSRPTTAAVPPPAAALVGTYVNPLYGTAAVAGADAALTLALGPGPVTFRLAPWDGPVFSYRPVGENATGVAAVTFSLDATGRSSAVTVENLQGEDPEQPLGVFHRV